MHHIDCYLLMNMQSVMAFILCTTSTVISLWTCSLSWPSSCAPHRLLSPYGHAVCHGHHPVHHIDCYLLMNMQSVMAFILCTTSTVISLWTCSLSWPSSCAPHRLLSPYEHAVCHGHHLVRHIDCYLLMDMQSVMAIILWKVTLTVISLRSVWPSSCTPTVISLWTCSLSWPSSCAPHRLLSPCGHAVCLGHHPVHHIDCYLLMDMQSVMAIVLWKITSTVISLWTCSLSWPSSCGRSR